MAKAMGVHAARFDDPADLEGAVKAAPAHYGPALVDVVTSRQKLSMQPKIELKQAKGFSLWVDGVMNGRAAN